MVGLVRQTKNLFWEKENRWVKVKIATSTLKTIQKVGLDEMAKRHDVDLYALPYTDYSDARRDWLKANQGKPPVKKNKRAMKHSTPKPTTV
jgi:ribosomal protein L28